MNAMTEVKRVGRPSGYNLELAIEICDAIAENGKGLRTLCAENDHWPSVTTILSWLIKHEEFQTLYARAKELQAEHMAEEILDISDEENGDAYIEYDKDGNPVAKLDGQAVQRSKLRVDTRKWLMAKLAPRKYGDKLDVTSGGEALPPPAPPVVIDARMQSLIAVAATRSHNGDSEPPAIEDLMG